MFEPRARMPHFVVTAVDGRVIDYRTIWQNANLLLVCLDESEASQPLEIIAAELAGRALSAYNLLIFVGVFVVQWGVGLLIDGFKFLGATEVPAHQGAMLVYGLLGLAGYLRFSLGRAKAGEG